MTSKLKKSLSACLLVLTAMIWGFAFVAQSVGSDHVGPFTFLASRSFIAGIALLPVILWRKKRFPVPQNSAPASRNHLWIGGIACGCALVTASAFQQSGIAYTTAGKAGFITALYIIIVPILSIFLKKRAPLSVWIGVLLAAAGMYLLCVKEGFTLSRGDFLVLICAFFYAVHILVIDHFSPLTDGVQMSCIQFFTCGTIAAIMMLVFERPSSAAILDAWLPILYAGLFSSAVGYTLQIIAQKNVPPTLASLLMSLESVFSVLAGWLLLKQALSPKELFGCVLVFLAVILAQLPDRKSAGNAEEK